jgi:hypothetical protein
MPDAQALMAKIQALPPERITEIEDFVDFINYDLISFDSCCQNIKLYRSLRYLLILTIDISMIRNCMEKQSTW